jgi:drug/metabolite transporter (DMT)-like permease
VIGFLLGFAGVVILMQPELTVSTQLNWLHLSAMLMILTGAISYAANSVIAHSLPKISLPLISAGVLLASSIVIIPISLWQGFEWVADTSARAMWSVILLGIFPSGLATIIYFSVIRQAGPAFLSQINYLIPVWAVLLGVVFAGEKLTINAVIALVVILVGIAIAQKNRSATAESIYHD